MDKLQVVYKRLDEIKPYENNPRLNDDAVEPVANSIKEFGFKVPIVVDKDGVIVAGHTRYKAAQKLGLQSVPCLVADDLSPEQIKAFRLADNKTGELADWDFNMLGEELGELDDFNMERFGFDDIENESKTSEPKDIAIDDTYSILVKCKDEKELEETFEHLQSEGYECQIFAS